MEEIKRNRRWSNDRKNTVEKNSGEVIVKENLSIKLRDLMDNWTTNPGLINGLKRSGIGYDENTLNPENLTVPPLSTDITDVERSINDLSVKKAADLKAKKAAEAKKLDAEKEAEKEKIIAEYELKKASENT